MKTLTKIFVLYKSHNGYPPEPVGFTDDWDFAQKWAEENNGQYMPLGRIE